MTSLSVIDQSWYFHTNNMVMHQEHFIWIGFILFVFSSVLNATDSPRKLMSMLCLLMLLLTRNQLVIRYSHTINFMIHLCIKLINILIFSFHIKYLSILFSRAIEPVLICWLRAINRILFNDKYWNKNKRIVNYYAINPCSLISLKFYFDDLSHLFITFSKHVSEIYWIISQLYF